MTARYFDEHNSFEYKDEEITMNLPKCEIKALVLKMLKHELTGLEYRFEMIGKPKESIN